ncbi:vicianin hydrolase-like [Alnus glutinosa]|uniref:vicianin hydrolase-like n=1 Tax=Alnus glutinosa TaxID=3517 RepID=UPI002D796C6F|nr:vicianin hydrolase-like [Alnus glutinosa]
MAVHQGRFLFCLLALASLCACTTESAKPSHYSIPFNRSLFPADFTFGTASAAYQYEGAARIDGKGPCTWDTFTEKHPEKIRGGGNGDVASDFYHRYKEDVKLMKSIGLDSFRFSISWARILPKGKLSGGVNPQGVKFYNNLINELLSNGIEPFVTLLHYDPPQALEDEYDGPLSPKIVKDFQDYADFCFKTFGDRVKLWVTMNEPNVLSINGYATGSFAPGRCSKHVGNCTAGNSATEPYIVAHNLLLAHGAAVKLYKDKYQPHQKGKIGITTITHWFEPKYQTSSCREAASRALDFYFGWFVDPVIYGDYPQSMKSAAGNRLPKFTEAQSNLLKGSLDFLGVNYYTTNYAEIATATTNGVNATYVTDRQTILTAYKNGTPIGTPTASDWIFVYPEGLYELLMYIKEKYNNPVIYITENGMGDGNNSSLPIYKVGRKDSLRIRYHYGHLSYLLNAIKGGVNVKAYYAWTLLDNFEWDGGYTYRYGLVFVDFKDNLKRYLKYSAFWFKMFLRK